MKKLTVNQGIMWHKFIEFLWYVLGIFLENAKNLNLNIWGWFKNKNLFEFWTGKSIPNKEEGVTTHIWELIIEYQYIQFLL